MNATMSSLPSELLSTWAHWKHPRNEAPPTPPMTSTLSQRKLIPRVQVTTTLPPIAHFDRHLSAMPPLTPPYLENVAKSTSASQPKLPPLREYSYQEPSNSMDVVVAEETIEERPFYPADAPHLIDWLDFSRTRSAHFIAEKTCEMICYLWFSSSPQRSYPSPTTSSPPFSHRTPATSSLQLIATPTFVHFMQKVLETTQVSQSVIVLSLHYIYRLKERNQSTAGQAGSEFRIAVAALMMANKFLDDNTYTNKTWSDVSGIDLDEINRMEREFLKGVDFNLYVDKATYESWLNLLKGLVLAKERDSRQWRKSRGLSRVPRLPNPQTVGPPSRTYSSTHRSPVYRARSTSPSMRHYSYTYPQPAPMVVSHNPSASPEPCPPSPTPRSGSKRSAEAAFSPTSATFAAVPSKRPIPTSLKIPEYSLATPSSDSPMEPLRSFSKMTLSPGVSQPVPSQQTPSTWTVSATRAVPETLAAAYTVDYRNRSTPQNLYFYSLSCSPMESEESQSRKGKLRFHQPTPTAAPPPPYYATQPSMPLNIQSASASPRDVLMRLAPPTLPHLHDVIWTRQVSPNAPSFYPSPTEQRSSLAQSAPFANAGPPGIHFYPTPSQQASPVRYAQWPRSRRL